MNYRTENVMPGLIYGRNQFWLHCARSAAAPWLIPHKKKATFSSCRAGLTRAEIFSFNSDPPYFFGFTSK